MYKKFTELMGSEIGLPVGVIKCRVQHPVPYPGDADITAHARHFTFHLGELPAAGPEKCGKYNYIIAHAQQITLHLEQLPAAGPATRGKYN